MLYQGQRIRATRIGRDFVELSFDNQQGINRMDLATAQELSAAVAIIGAADGARGVLVTSQQSGFVAGADAAEHAALLRRPQHDIETVAREMSESLRALEELPFPVVAGVAGAAVDGGLELALAADFRVMSATAQTGLSQVRWGVLPHLYKLLAPSQPHGARDFTDTEIVERMMLPMVLEAAVALEEGVVESAAALDTAMSLGLGFPKYAGGPLKYADWLGLDKVVEMSERQAGISPQFRASDELRRMAANGGKFYGAQ